MATAHVEGLILCGGQALRMGGQDKGLLPFKQQALYLHSVAKLAPQVDQTMLNANRHLDIYAQSGLPVYSDTFLNYSGPLAGFHVGLSHCQAPYLAIVPCDSPYFPDDLVARLMAALQTHQADVAYVVTQQGAQTFSHPVFCLLRNGLKDHLHQYLQQGERKIDRWFEQLQSTRVLFPDESAFMNMNTPEELAHGEGLQT